MDLWKKPRAQPVAQPWRRQACSQQWAGPPHCQGGRVPRPRFAAGGLDRPSAARRWARRAGKGEWKQGVSLLTIAVDWRPGQRSGEDGDAVPNGVVEHALNRYRSAVSIRPF